MNKNHNNIDTNTRISIIVPVYNKELFVEKCLKSLINQTYQNIEIICVDDGSTDHSGDMCERYKKIDARIKVIHTENKGNARARKIALANCTGQFVMAVDCDDWLELRACEILINIEKNTSADIIEFGLFDSTDESEKYRLPYFPEGLYDRYRLENEVFPKMIYTGDYFQHGIFAYIWSKFYKKNIIYEHIMNVGEYTNMDEDTVCVFPCVASANSLYVLQKSLYHYRIVNNSIRHTWDISLENKEKQRMQELRDLLRKSHYYDVFLKQIDIFEKYSYAVYSPQVFDYNKELCLNVYGGIPRGAKIAIYGAGAAGIILSDYIRSSKCCDIICHVDINYKNMIECGISDPKELLEINVDYIVVSVLRRSAYLSSLETLRNLNIDEFKIRWIRSDLMG